MYGTVCTYLIVIFFVTKIPQFLPAWLEKAQLSAELFLCFAVSCPAVLKESGP